jgi:Concanavalin A-like lectin/glucanases superfamily
LFSSSIRSTLEGAAPAATAGATTARAPLRLNIIRVSRVEASALEVHMLSLRLALDRVVDGTFEDSSRNRWPTTCTNVKPILHPDERFMGCAYFNGVSSAIRIAGMACPSNFTFTTWLKKDAGLSFYYATILAFGGDSPYFGLYRGRPVLGNSLVTTHELSASWNHVAVTQDMSGSKIYVNGALVGSSISRASTDGTGLGIGRDLSRGHAWFHGAMAELMIFDEALSVATLGQVMEAFWREPPALLVDARSLPEPVAPPSPYVAPPSPYTEHVPLLRKLHEAFPAVALGDLIAALGAGADPAALSSGLAGALTPTGIWTFQLDVGPFFLLGAGDVAVLVLEGAEEGSAAALCIELTPSSLARSGRLSARLKGRLKLLHGAISVDIDEEVRPEEGVRITRSGGAFGDAAVTTIDLRSSRRCELSIFLRFSYAVRIRGREIQLPLSTSMSATVDGSLFQQQIAYSFEMDGEEISISAPHHRPILSVQELIGVFEHTALADLEQRVSEGIAWRGAETNTWDDVPELDGELAARRVDARSLPEPVVPPSLCAEHVPRLWKLHEAFPAVALGDLIAALGAGADPGALSPGLAGGSTREGRWTLQADVEPVVLLGAGGVTILSLSGAEERSPAALCIDLATSSREMSGKLSARLKGRLRLLDGAISADIDEEVLPDGGIRVTLSGAVFGEAADTTIHLHSSRRCELSLRVCFSHSIGIRGHQILLPLSAAMNVAIDGTVFQQHIAYFFDMAGEEILVSTPHHWPIMSEQELIKVFENTALANLEQEISETIERRGAAALKWLRHKFLEAVDLDLRDTAALLFRR